MEYFLFLFNSHLRLSLKQIFTVTKFFCDYLRKMAGKRVGIRAKMKFRMSIDPVSVTVRSVSQQSCYQMSLAVNDGGSFQWFSMSAHTEKTW